jgi:CRP/FNR family transcriptional regulator, cyclic AMP receptor protein
LITSTTVSFLSSRKSGATNMGSKCFRSFGSQSLLSSLPVPVARDLQRKLILVRRNPGSILYRQGENADSIFLVLEGRVKMVAIDVDGKTVLLRIAGPGEVLGLAAVVSTKMHLTTAQATLPSVIALLHQQDLADQMRNCTQLSEAVAQCLARECEERAIDMLLLRAASSRSQRLAAILLRLADDDDTGVHREPALTYTHAELGQLIGASRETITRLMKQFERRGVIKTKHSTFQIVDAQALGEIARLGLTSAKGIRLPI